MSDLVEREIKLRYPSPDAARDAVGALGGSLRTARRLQSDVILDTVDGRLRDARSALRVRIEASQSYLTFKGAPRADVMKVREEIETAVEDGTLALAILERLGFVVAFTYRKFREEYELEDVLVAIDETPIGTFMELEGAEDAITSAALRLGFLPADYVADSYRALYLRHCEQQGVQPGDRMDFAD